MNTNEKCQLAGIFHARILSLYVHYFVHRISVALYLQKLFTATQRFFTCTSAVMRYKYNQ